MVWILIGLAIPTLVSIEGAVSSDKSNRLKVFLIGLAILGFSIASYSSYEEQRLKREAQKRADVMAEKVDASNKQLLHQGELLRLVNLTVGDLGMLNRLSGGDKYYVRIAADTSKERLKRYLTDIEHKFSGAKSSGLVSIRDPRPGSHNYELVFGGQLDVAAAEVFLRLADLHHFPPDKQFAEIQREQRPSM